MAPSGRIGSRNLWVLMLIPILLAACDNSDFATTAGSAALPVGNTTDLADLLHDDTDAAYQRAIPGTPLVFPRDHGPHPKFRSGWWYFTGNLQSSAGQNFGYQLTFFRLALRPGISQRPSAWGSRQVYMAHIAITDIGAGKFYRQQRLSRAGLKLAGAAASPFNVWLEDLQVRSLQPGAFFPLQLTARADTEAGEISIRLQLQAGKARVLQGDNGYSAKSLDSANASYYYSYTRLPSSGTLQTPRGRFKVRGQSWFDREWSTSALAAKQTGWDWFALQLADGRDLMFYRLRLRDGGIDAASAGVLVTADSTQRRISLKEMQLQPLRYWQSPGGRKYPVAWTLHYQNLQLQVVARLDAQAYSNGIPYWEGAVEVSGGDSGVPVSGLGYLEMSGY